MVTMMSGLTKDQDSLTSPVLPLFPTGMSSSQISIIQMVNSVRAMSVHGQVRSRLFMLKSARSLCVVISATCVYHTACHVSERAFCEYRHLKGSVSGVISNFGMSSTGRCQEGTH